jgi:hypothetical protein
VKNATVPNVVSYPIEPLAVGLTGEKVSNIGGTEKDTFTKTYTTTSQLTNLYSLANTNSFQKTFGYKVGCLL